jgi:hypothetical protein
MQDPAYLFRRIPLPRTRLNKGIKKGRGHEVPRGPTPTPSFISYNSELVALVQGSSLPLEGSVPS